MGFRHPLRFRAVIPLPAGGVPAKGTDWRTCGTRTAVFCFERMSVNKFPTSAQNKKPLHEMQRFAYQFPLRKEGDSNP